MDVAVRLFQWRVAVAAALVMGLSACGGGGDGSNPLGNPPLVSNALDTGGQRLSFEYFQRCINPILLAQLPVLGGGNSTNSCASAGCHAPSGTGGALRVVPNAQPVDLANPANTPAVIRASDMYKNFYSSHGEVVVGAPTQSRMLAKPVLLVLHGGGQIFADINDANAARIAYWINHPVPKGQDEFNAAAAAIMFTPQNPLTGTCNTQ